MLHIYTIFSSHTVSGRHLVKRSDIITGRGFAAPPKLNIDTYPSPEQGHLYTDNELQHHGPQQQQPQYSYRQPQHQSYLPQSDYHKLQQKLSTNDQLRSYIKTLRQQLNEYKNIVPHNHERGTIVDLNQYDSGRYKNIYDLFNRSQYNFSLSLQLRFKSSEELQTKFRY